MYDLYGSEESVWKDYIGETKTEKKEIFLSNPVIILFLWRSQQQSSRNPIRKIQE